MSVTVLKAGLQTTVQSRSRVGLRHQGVPASGAADPLSLALANRLVGNGWDTPALEATLLGPTLRFEQACAFAIVGALARATLNGVEIEQSFNPWLNLHRPCLFATEIVSPKGKIVKRYKHKDVKTPLECLVLLDKQGLVAFKTSATLTALLVQSKQMTDLAAAQQMQHAKSRLFTSFAKQKRQV